MTLNFSAFLPVAYFDSHALPNLAACSSKVDEFDSEYQDLTLDYSFVVRLPEFFSTLLLPLSGPSQQLLSRVELYLELLTVFFLLQLTLLLLIKP